MPLTLEAKYASCTDGDHSELLWLINEIIRVFPIDLVMNERMGETRSAWKKAVIKLNLPSNLSNPLIVTMDGDVLLLDLLVPVVLGN